MTVGEALAEARYRAGLSVDELSERTRIREAVIRCIEQDDYDACGGDLYVRGYVRAIAGAVGIDAQPLIREYDLARTDAPGDTQAAHAPAAVTSAADTSAAVTRPEPIAVAVASDTTVDPVITTGNPAPPGGRPRGRRRAAGITAGAAIVLAAAGVAGAVLAGGHSHSPSAAISAAAAQQAKQPAVTGGNGVKAGQSASPGAASAAPSAAPKPSETAKPSAGNAPAMPAVRALPIAFAEAFGPGGVADGDNPQGALFPITPGAQLPWRSHWYATPNFGLLKPGTGLLIDMGKRVTVSGVRIVLAPYRGADVQLRAGTVAALPDLKVAARASGAGGTVRFGLRSPQRVRYLLIWFTLLPPNGAGQYQASLYHVVVYGHS
ncbi:MAG: helix-turn-helix domain-containing protein [Micromonosporaceae bacterium]